MDVHLPHIPSEDYAEVGPFRSDQRLPVSHDYSEIREFLPEAGLHLSTASHSGQVLLSLTQLQPSSPVQSPDCHTPNDAPALLPTPFAMHNLSVQFCDIISANENEGDDVMDDHTYHVLQLSGYSSSDNTSEVADPAAKVGSVRTEEGIVATVPFVDPVSGGVAQGLTTLSETCVSTRVVALGEVAIHNTTYSIGEVGYSQLVKILASASIPNDGIPLPAPQDPLPAPQDPLPAPQDPLSAPQEDAYSHLVRVVPFGNSGESRPTSDVQSAPIIAVGSEIDEHLITAGPITSLDAPHLMFPMDGPHSMCLPSHNLPMFLALPSNAPPSDAPPKGTGRATGPEGITMTQDGVAAMPPLGPTSAEQAGMAALSKYGGDYERDSAYMGALQWAHVRPSTTYVSQMLPNDAHLVTATTPHVWDNAMCLSMESLCSEAHLYQALMPRTRNKSKEYTDLRLDGDQSKLCMDGDQSKPCMDGDQSKPCMDLRLDGDQCTNSHGNQLKRHIDLEFGGNQLGQYTNVQLDSNQ